MMSRYKPKPPPGKHAYTQMWQSATDTTQREIIAYGVSGRPWKGGPMFGEELFAVGATTAQQVAREAAIRKRKKSLT